MYRLVPIGTLQNVLIIKVSLLYMYMYIIINSFSLSLSYYSNGLPPSNEDDESIHSGSTRSEVPPIMPPVQLVGKGKQLPKVSVCHTIIYMYNIQHTTLAYGKVTSKLGQKPWAIVQGLWPNFTKNEKERFLHFYNFS